MYRLYFYLRNLVRREDGQDLAEYAILIGLIAIAVILAVTLLGGEIRNIFQAITGSLQDASIPASP